VRAVIRLHQQTIKCMGGLGNSGACSGVRLTSKVSAHRQNVELLSSMQSVTICTLHAFNFSVTFLTFPLQLLVWSHRFPH
jgi:hypothetical protein